MINVTSRQKEILQEIDCNCNEVSETDPTSPCSSPRGRSFQTQHVVLAWPQIMTGYKLTSYRVDWEQSNKPTEKQNKT